MMCGSSVAQSKSEYKLSVLRLRLSWGGEVAVGGPLTALRSHTL